MRILTLVRHAKSSWDAPALPDFERPLNERGRRDAPAVASRLHQAGVRPDRIVSSPALRAITTARIFAETFGTALEDIQLDSRIYEASAATLLIVVQALTPEAREAMLFGHNPGLSEAAHVLAQCPFDDMPTCAAVRIQFTARDWSQIRAESGKVLLYEYPKKNR